MYVYIYSTPRPKTHPFAIFIGIWGICLSNCCLLQNVFKKRIMCSLFFLLYKRNLDSICILASVCFAYQSNLQLCNILLNLLLLLLKDVGYALQPKPRENQKAIKHNFSGNGWSEAHVWNSWFYLVFFGVTSKKQNNSTLIGFLDKTMELKWWNTTKNQGFLLVFSWFENPRKKLLKSMGRNTTQARLENTIRTQVSACTLKKKLLSKQTSSI